MDSTVQEGQILAGKFRVDRVLGVGGMGIVVAAHHLELDDRVAIKFLLPETLGNPEAVLRFAREARAAVRIKSEHVARVSDVGKLENGAPYMVMEYLKGSDLSGWLSEHGPLPIDQAIDFTLQASEAIAEAHSLGIVHRDLKPANLFLIRRPDGGLSIKVLDFGISKTTSLTGSGGEGSMTKTSTLLGSPLYMSPEQIRSSKEVDARADIWALGVILYELLTGSAPFGGEHLAELIYQIVSVPPPPMRNRRADIPEGLERVIVRALEKNREDRFASIAEMAAALLPFAPQRSRISVERISGLSGGALPAPAARTVVLAPVAASSAAGESDRGAGTQASWGSTAVEKGKGARRRAAALAGLAAVAVVASGVAFWRVAASGPATASSRATSALGPEPVAPATQAAPAQEASPAPPPPSPEVPASPPSATNVSPSLKASPARPPEPARTLPRPPAQGRPKSPTKKAPEPTDPWGASQH